MRRKLTRALGVMALGFLGSNAQADEPKLPTIAELAAVSGQPAAKDVAKDATQPPEGPVPFPADAGDSLAGCAGCKSSGKGGFAAGVGVLWVQPNFETNPAFRVRTSDGTTTSERQQDFRWSAEGAPLAWLAYTQDNGLGVRARWFMFDQDVSESFANDAATIVTVANPLGVLTSAEIGVAADTTFQSDLQLDVWDLEVTQAVQAGPWSLLLAGGVRYVHLSQNYGFVASTTSAPLLTATLQSEHDFNGAGPTFALEARRAVGGGGLTLYGNGRASILFGTAHQEVSFVHPTAGVFQSSARQADVLPIGEIEIGVEYGRDVGPVRAFAQAGFHGQVWWGGGNAANVAVSGGSSDNSSNFGFVGGAFRLGFDF